MVVSGLIDQSSWLIDVELKCLADSVNNSSHLYTAWNAQVSLAPPYLVDDCNLVSNDIRRLRSAVSFTCALPRTRTRLGDRSFAVAGPRVCNCLPAALRAVEDYERFKKLLKHICSTNKVKLYTAPRSKKSLGAIAYRLYDFISITITLTITDPKASGAEVVEDGDRDGDTLSADEWVGQRQRDKERLKRRDLEPVRHAHSWPWPDTEAAADPVRDRVRNGHPDVLLRLTAVHIISVTINLATLEMFICGKNRTCQHCFSLVDCLIHSRDIRDQSLQLSEI